MALIKCPECGKNVSESAESCPNCGLNIKRHLLQQKLNDQEKKVKEVREIYENKKMKLTQDCTHSDFQPPTMTKAYIFFALAGIFLIITILCLLLLSGVIVGDGSSPIGLLIFSVIFLFITGCGATQFYKTQKQEMTRYKNDPETYRKIHSKTVPLSPEQTKRIEQQVSEEYKAYRNELEKLGEIGKQLNPKASQEIKNHIPRCPHCNSTKIRPISTASRVVSVAAVGVASGKIGKQFECLNCKYKW